MLLPETVAQTCVSDAFDSVPGWAPSFPSADLVAAAAALLPGEARPGRGEVERFRLEARTRMWEDVPEREWSATGQGWGFREGPQWRIEVAPGVVSVRSEDYARRERTMNRLADACDPRRSHWRGPVCPVGSCLHESCSELRVSRLDFSGSSVSSARVVSSWSRKSRNRMVQRLSELDWTPLFAGGGLPAMATVTYPGGHKLGCGPLREHERCHGCGWVSWAPSAAVCQKHIQALQSRFLRKYGTKLVGAWKREFQGRGAPHYHIMMVPPDPDFRFWLSDAWSAIVAESARKDGRLPFDHLERIEDHRKAGTGVDYAKGMRSSDPRRVAVYFSKHGVWSAKDYQNDAPAEWDETESVGRFWGVWGLDAAVVAVDVDPAEALAAVRVLRRYSRANRRRRPAPFGNAGTLKVPSRSRHRVMSYGAGFVLVNDGANVAARLAVALDRLAGRDGPVYGAAWKSGATPMGPLDGYGVVSRTAAVQPA